MDVEVTFGFGALEVVVGAAEVVSSVGSAGFAEVVEGAGCAEVVVSLPLVGSGFGALDVVVGAGVCSVVVTAGVLMTSVLTVIASALSHATSSGCQPRVQLSGKGWISLVQRCGRSRWNGLRRYQG
ncbi:hypothetical protein [Corynebacterium casei]|uniref:hypothetical protein n=1 Tax=Corynebacterium casei TaxID=160386 RepID=UPI0023F24955|nr:hypothetical protein [Corynebacterium casei]